MHVSDWNRTEIRTFHPLCCPCLHRLEMLSCRRKNRARPLSVAVAVLRKFWSVLETVAEQVELCQLHTGCSLSDQLILSRVFSRFEFQIGDSNNSRTNDQKWISLLFSYLLLKLWTESTKIGERFWKIKVIKTQFVLLV